MTIRNLLAATAIAGMTVATTGTLANAQAISLPSKDSEMGYTAAIDIDAATDLRRVIAIPGEPAASSVVPDDALLGNDVQTADDVFLGRVVQVQLMPNQTRRVIIDLNPQLRTRANVAFFYTPDVGQDNTAAAATVTDVTQTSAQTGAQAGVQTDTAVGETVSQRRGSGTVAANARTDEDRDHADRTDADRHDDDRAERDHADNDDAHASSRSSAAASSGAQSQARAEVERDDDGRDGDHGRDAEADDDMNAKAKSKSKSKAKSKSSSDDGKAKSKSQSQSKSKSSVNAGPGNGSEDPDGDGKDDDPGNSEGKNKADD